MWLPPSNSSSRFKINPTILALFSLMAIFTAAHQDFTLQTYKVRAELNSALNKYAESIEINSMARHQLSAGMSLTAATDDTSCVRVLQNLTNYFLSNNDTVERIIRNSGKDYNDLGRYYDCLDTKGFRYILATVPHALPITISVGMCVPQVCTV